MKIYLVRHGETTINKQYRFLGHFDVDLSPEGVKQAQIAASVVCSAVVCSAVADNTAKKTGRIKLYSSDLARTIQTAKIIAGATGNDGAIIETSHGDAVAGAPCELEVHGRKDLREIDFGDWEGLTYDEIRAVDGQQFDAWIKDYTSVRIPGGESWADFTFRIASAVHDILEDADEDETIVVATHGGPIRFITSCFIQDADHFQNFWPSPGSVHMLDVVKRDVSETSYLARSDMSLASRDMNSAGSDKNDDNSDGGNHVKDAAGGDGENGYQTDGCLKLSRAYKLENYRFNLQIS